MQPNGEVVVITGASAGLGRAIAERFADQGARIGLIARGRERLEATGRDVESRGGRALIIQADVANADAIENAAEAVEREFGPIDVWINNAMASVFSPVTEMQASEYRRVTDVTYLGYVYGTLAALKRMRSRDRGVIIHVGSALAHRSIPLQSAYCAAKHAVMGFHESLITELLHEKSRVRATMVQMPAMNTPQFDWVKSRLPNEAEPVPPIFQPEVGADAVFYAAHHDVGRELLVGWPTVKAVFANKIVPAYIDRRLAAEGYESQQTGEPADPTRPNNLFQPAPGNWGAHGRFDAQSKSRSAELWLRRHRDWLLLGGAALAGLTLGALPRRHSDRSPGT
jgi:NAD(P)-dependent dehydrogenase (short-subunit alcohol dehydrogenase family)